MKQIISHIGVIGSGKDFYSNNLVIEKDFIHHKFANSVVEAAWKLLKYIPVDSLEYEKFKESTFECKELGIKFTGRDLLIRVGNDMGRDLFGKEFWIERVVDKMKKQLYNNFVFSDTRYLNEAKALIKFAEDYNYEVKFIFCNFKSERFNKNIFSESEFLAQCLLEKGCSDKEDITNIIKNLIIKPPTEFLSIKNKNEVKLLKIGNFFPLKNEGNYSQMFFDSQGEIIVNEVVKLR
jgi:hypothetical protein